MIKSHQSDENLSAHGIEVRVSSDCGFLEFAVKDEGRSIDMLHRAPWIETVEVFGDGVVPHLKGLKGDFFCAPFADATADGAPLHGHPANGTWARVSCEPIQGGERGRWNLKGRALGAQVTKEVTVRDMQPFVYQRHTLAGGSGRWPVANHAMLNLATGGIIRTSPMRAALPGVTRPTS